jgi:hypothetical protein
VETIEKLFVLEALKRNSWNVTKSAKDTGMQRANFQALMKKYCIRVRDTERRPEDRLRCGVPQAANRLYGTMPYSSSTSSYPVNIALKCALGVGPRAPR